ncbi:neurofilament heavy polypeptide-like isoform X2 [Abrus precatorius]|uniref:Neurofilament heavy polypeptide-like isoform X2 n=1 Tax=Abrus precatorius TaxID=3816 RepID=A0A8B8M396_ABRPR|nr:neurofilament heavy polypeptide-like isoform X2 [Abrus precatorius]
MAATDSHGNSQSEFSDRKRCREEEENPETLTSLEQCSKKKKKRKKKNKGQEANEHPQVQVCPNPLLEDTLIPIVSPKEKTEATAQKTKENVQGAQHLQTCKALTPLSIEPNIRKEKGAPLDDANANGDGDPCSKHETAVPEKRKGEGSNEAAAENPVNDPISSEDISRKKKSKKKKKNVLSSLVTEPEQEVEPKESSNTDCPQQYPELMNNTEKGTEPKEANAEHSGVWSKPELAFPLDVAILKDSELKKGAEPAHTNIEHPQVCSKRELSLPLDLATSINKKKNKVGGGEAHATNSEKRKEAEVSEGLALHPQPQPCTKPDPEPPGDLITAVDQSRGKQKNKSGRKRKMCSEEKEENQINPLHLNITLNHSLNKIQSEPATTISPKPTSLTDQTIPVDPAIPKDTEQKSKNKKRKKQKNNVLDGEELNEHITEQPETPIQTPTCLIAASPIDPTIPMDPCPAIPISPVISKDPEHKMSKNKRKKERKSALKGEGAEPDEHNGNPPEGPTDAPDQKSVYLSAPSIDLIIPIGQTPPVDTATSIEQDQMMAKKKINKKRRSALMGEGEEPNEHDGKPSNASVHRSIYTTAAASIDPTIPTGQALPVDPATPAAPVDSEQKMTKRKKKKKSELISTVEELNEHNGKSPDASVGRSIYPTAAPSIDPTGQAPAVDTATPVAPEQKMTKKKRKKKRKSALISEGAEPNEHDGKPPGTPVKISINPIAAPALDSEQKMTMKKNSALRSDGLESKKHSADPPTETPVPRRRSSVTEVPFEWVGENSVRCMACRGLGHTFQRCRRLRGLPMDAEVCFFCGEIGHSLGKCSVSQAGGGRFAKCLFCYKHGHFSYNCPRNGHRIEPNEAL